MDIGQPHVLHNQENVIWKPKKYRDFFGIKSLPKLVLN